MINCSSVLHTFVDNTERPLRYHRGDSVVVFLYYQHKHFTPSTVSIYRLLGRYGMFYSINVPDAPQKSGSAKPTRHRTMYTLTRFRRLLVTLTDASVDHESHTTCNQTYEKKYPFCSAHSSINFLIFKLACYTHYTQNPFKNVVV